MAGDRTDLVLEGLAVPEGLDALHDLIEQARTSFAEVPADAWMALETAVIEVAGNVAEHGRPVGQVRWHLTLRVAPGAVEAVLADDGHEYAGDLDAAMPDPLAESGRGFALAGAVLDDFDYERRGDVNVWTMRRGYSASSAPG